METNLSLKTEINDNNKSNKTRKIKIKYQRKKWKKKYFHKV